MTDLKVSAEGGTHAEGVEFVVNAPGDEGLKVKAFIPEWLRERLKKPRKPRNI